MATRGPQIIEGVYRVTGSKTVRALRTKWAVLLWIALTCGLLLFLSFANG